MKQPQPSHTITKHNTSETKQQKQNIKQISQHIHIHTTLNNTNTTKTDKPNNDNIS